MHGLINKAVEGFVTDTYGDLVWKNVVALAELDEPHFEAMMLYDRAVTPRVVACAAQIIGADREDFLQSLGTYLVSHPSGQGIRRLLRFGGVNFVDFLYSLDDLRDRARLAVSELDLPKLELREHTSSQFSVTVRSEFDGFGHVLVGLLTAMADDYGALIMMEHGGRQGDVETVSIALLEAAFSDGNGFELGAIV